MGHLLACFLLPVGALFSALAGLLNLALFAGVTYPLRQNPGAATFALLALLLFGLPLLLT